MKVRFCIQLLALFLSLDLDATIYPYETPVSKYLKDVDVTEFDSGLEGIDCIYMINLERRPEKWERMRALFHSLGLYPNRFLAVDGLNITEDHKKELAGNYPIRMPNGWIGCLLSHVSVIKDALSRNFEQIWIVEDDVEIVGEVSKLPYLLEKLRAFDPGWDIFYTDSNFRRKEGYLISTDSDFRPDGEYYPLEHYRRRKVIDEDIIEIGQRFGTRSFILSRSGMEKLYHYFTHIFLWTAIDIDMHYTPGIKQYVSATDIVSNSLIRLYGDTGNPLDGEN